MSTYAIGDLQGCFLSLQSLLQKIRFSPQSDRLWFVGDLVNRGPDSLACLRFVKMLGDRAVTVLGNHDLNLLSVAARVRELGDADTLQPILDAADCESLLTWLRRQKLFHVQGNYAMVHAGLMPTWSWSKAQALAREVEISLRGSQYKNVLKNMYGNEPNHWDDGLVGHERHRVIINAMTRLRAVTLDGGINLKFKGEPDDVPEQHRPWFMLPCVRAPDYTLLAGHWSALGLHLSPHFVGLDSGCVWGRELTAFRLEDRTVFRVPCAEAEPAMGWD